MPRSPLSSSTARVLLTTFPGPVLVVDSQGNVVACNAGCERGYRVSEPDSIGRDLSELATDPVLDARRRHIDRALSSRSTVQWEDEHDNRRFDNRAVPVLRGSELTGAVVFSRDVTDERAWAEERERLTEQVRHAQKLEAINRLGGGLAHDFNNLLTAILGHAAHLRLTVPSDEVIAEADAIEDAVRRAAGLTRRLLTFARRDRTEPRVVVLDEVVRGLETMLSRLLGDEVELTLVTDAAGARVAIEPTALDQVVVNLATNARDAMPGGGRIELRTRVVEDGERQWAQLEVADNGTGIPPEIIEYVCEPFFSTKEESRGTGLGLATVHDIVRDHRGGLDIQSAPGQGTTVQLRFPLYGEEASGRRVGPALVAPGREKRTGKVLVVDDAELVRDVVCQVLRHAGFDALAATDRASALAVHAERGPVDLLLSDISMPGGTGPELARDLRERQPDLPVMLMTGYGGSEKLGAEVDAPVLGKPFSADELIRRVDALLGTSKG